ncbi:aspartate--tRNA ligase [Candidatus Falkowbacteria bacterium]|nr:aspartate--tRNA ligase [Candidatus Falkowbacteria bacterium]
MKTYVNEILAKVGQEVELKGWVHVRRDMGKIAFIDLRDSTGIVQVVLVPAELGQTAELMKELRPEYVVAVRGLVQERQEKNVNKDLATGKLEVLAKSLNIINRAETPPFEIANEDRQANEELRLQYRYLDLRHERLAKNMKTRSAVIRYVIDYLVDRGFTYLQTPMLSKSTPEGARDYLVPSRVHQGKFFALPQSPQQYKQLLMVAGFEKYFQIAPCFRDEDARADRSPGEFYQIDMETSFFTQNDILELTEGMFTTMVKKLFPEKHFTFSPWPRLKHDDVKKEYGTDKPDLRQDKNDPHELAFAWVIDFPLFTAQSQEDFFHGSGSAKWAPSHHMFTAPKEEDVALLDTDPGRAHSYQHDLVLNGLEVGGGSIRIHDPLVQQKIWDLIGFSAEQKEQFKHLIEAFKYGVPPHGGIAPGLDRLISILCNEQNIREVIAFPLTGDVRDPLMGAPSEVSAEQLDELGLAITKKK